MGIEKNVEGSEILAIQQKLGERIFHGYSPSHTLESAEDHWIPFDKLTDEQFGLGIDIGVRKLADAGRMDEARKMARNYGRNFRVYH